MFHATHKGSLAGCRVLVIEDEMLVAMATEDALADAGCIVVGPIAMLPKALSIIDQENQVDGAVVDMNLSGVSSLPIVEALSRQGIPFIILTGYGQIELPDTCHPAHILSKPVDHDQLLSHFRLAVTGQSFDQGYAA